MLTNIEAYDQWPSKPETPYLKMILNPVTGPFFRLAFGFEPLQREAYDNAFYHDSALTDEMLSAFVEPQLATPGRWCRLRRFFGWQIDPKHNQETMLALDGMKQFDRPVLILWGEHDTNFGPAIAERLAKDIPGVVRVRMDDQFGASADVGRAPSLWRGADQVLCGRQLAAASRYGSGQSLGRGENTWTRVRSRRKYARPMRAKR